MQRAKKENAKMKEQIEKQRLAREREVGMSSWSFDWDSLMTGSVMVK